MTTSQHLTTSRRFARSEGGGLVLALCAVDAGLMVTSGLIHLHLWRIAYRHVTVGHLNDLFLVQTIAAFVAALAILVLRRRIVVAGSAALMAGTVVGFLIARYRSAGLFGFKLGISTSDAKWALAVEIAAVAVLALTALAMTRTLTTSRNDLIR